MNRYAGFFRVKMELLLEYKKCHDKIWPEMREEINKCGIQNHSLFARPDGLVFVYAEAENLQASMSALAQTEVNSRWQREMRKFFVDIDDLTNSAKTEMIPEIFHLD